MARVPGSAGRSRFGSAAIDVDMHPIVVLITDFVNRLPKVAARLRATYSAYAAAGGPNQMEGHRGRRLVGFDPEA
jgi:hypothetical protein